jgi:hypothetical protein
MCFAGLKLTRIYQLKVSNIFSEHVRLPGKGGNEYYDIPLNKHAKEILKSYEGKDYRGGTCFPYYHNPYFNRLLKQLGKEAGVNRFVKLEILAGTEKGTREVPKYEILTSKVAVNTFLFNGLRLGISSEVLAYIADQKTLAGIERIRPLLEHTAFDDIRKFDILPS